MYITPLPPGSETIVEEKAGRFQETETWRTETKQFLLDMPGQLHS